MNESNQLIGEKLRGLKKKIFIKKSKDYPKSKKLSNIRACLIVTIILILILLCLFGMKFYRDKKRNNLINENIYINIENNKSKIETSINKETKSENKQTKENIKLKFNTEKYGNDKNIEQNNEICNDLDPIKMFNDRLKNTPTTICKSESSSHICYKNTDSIYVAGNGVICTMENIILDPSKWKDGKYIYKGPVDQENRGCPLLEKGFFNMRCKGEKNEFEGYDRIYNKYFEGWNYNFDGKEDEEELAPGKTIFFLSRNQDSPNLYHGGSEFINTLSMLYLLDIDPEKIQIVFLESMALNDDPFYDLYKNLISRGGEPIYIRNMTKRYHISSAIHVPINWDSPCFIYSEVPTCDNPTRTYKYYNSLIDKYMNITKFEDNFKTDGEIFYYPKSIIDNHNSSIKFTKTVTFQWRRVWPKGRKGQQRILGNGPELAEKLSESLPKNINLRLIDTASLPISEQISIMRNTDYYVGIHGAGLCLSIYSPKNCIFHEVLPSPNMNGLLLMAALSGHKTYSDIVEANIKDIDGNEEIFFKEEEFVKLVIEHMKENKLID